MQLPERVKVVEVGPRDGFQTESKPIPTERKIWVIDSLRKAGVTEIEATSFVHPRFVPQMADAAEVMAGIGRAPGVRHTSLVPNVKGAERALAAGADVLRLVICSTDTFNRTNVGMSVDESFRDAERILDRASERSVPVCVTIGLAFGCPFEGDVPVLRVVELVRRLVETGVHEICLADSAGLGNPRLFTEVVPPAREAAEGRPFSLHIHDTRGLGIANALAAMQCGVDTFDSSFGGLGGCPMNPGATGNISTEDLVNLCEEMGVPTGIDLDRIRRVSRWALEFLERDLPSHVLAMGTREELYEQVRIREDRKREGGE